MIKLPNDWHPILENIIPELEARNIEKFLDYEYDAATVYPKREDIFNALELTRYEDVKVVILGQDPYHGENQAHGLSFSVQPGVKIPPSLRNIYRELESDLSIKPPSHGHLIEWSKQGVLLLNAVLTVRKAEPNSHKGMGWELLTDEIIKQLNVREKPIVFILWGKFAQEKKSLITNEKHVIIESAHPSPFSAYRGFVDSKPFSKTNEALEKKGLKPINWEVSENVLKDK